MLFLRMKQIRFRNKRYGWGWVPVTWQGRVITLVYTLAIIALALMIHDQSTLQQVLLTFVIPMLVITIAFIFIAYKRGEKPERRWGEKKS